MDAKNEANQRYSDGFKRPKVRNISSPGIVYMLAGIIAISILTISRSYPSMGIERLYNQSSHNINTEGFHIQSAYKMDKNEPNKHSMRRVAKKKTVNSITVNSIKDRNYDNLIFSISEEHGVDHKLVKAIIDVESRFNPQAVSYKGATGLMQLMPATAERFGVENIYDPEDNIQGGVKYLKQLFNLFDGRIDLILAAYNAGEGRVIEAGYKIPQITQTQNYCDKVMNLYEKYLTDRS
jgi:soluble lytic murein transglycosylase-like protein